MEQKHQFNNIGELLEALSPYISARLRTFAAELSEFTLMGA